VSADDPQRVTVHGNREVVVEFDPDLTFECVEECTWCCHHGVMLYERDVWELANFADLSEATTDLVGEDFVRREAKDREEHVGEDGGACYFLREDGLCALHTDHDWKPTRCSIFPLEVHVGGETHDGDPEIHVSIREEAHEHCDGLDVSDRRVVDNLEAFLPEVLWELSDPETRRELE